MKLGINNKIKINYLLLAFLAPIIGMFAVMIVRGFIPFGKISMLYSDMYYQYYPFFVSFRKALLSKDSLLFTWSVGMGMDYLGLISYYLGSPLNLLSVFVPESLLLAYFSLLTPIKLGFAGLFFAIFLKKLYGKNDFSLVLFSTCYALCAWAVGYQWNIMWLDTFALLPLVVLGAISVLQHRKFVLYVFTLFLSIFANYYIGFFICIFIALVFLCYEICRWKGIKKFFYDLLHMILYSAIAIGMTAILELPALAALQNTYSSINRFPDSFSLNIANENTFMGLLDAMRQVAGNTNAGLIPTFKEGLPNLYCSIFANIFVFLFLLSRQIKLRDKLCGAFLLLFFNVSFILRQLDYIWHGFHFTNMIPYRFSFLYSFVVLYMAYRAYLLRHRFRLPQILAAIALAIGLALCANDITNPIYLVYNGLLLLSYSIVFLFPHLQKRLPSKSSTSDKRVYLEKLRNKQRTYSYALWGILIIELSLNLVMMRLTLRGKDVSDYPAGTTDAYAAIQYMKENDSDLFYRTECTRAQTLNDGALNNYNGISTFTSSANMRIIRFMNTLGYGARGPNNQYFFEEGSPIANLFLNLKYMLERNNEVEENPYFDAIAQYGDVHLLESNAYLPLGFLAEVPLADIDFSQKIDPFDFQNQLFSAATGIENNVWTPIDNNQLAILGEGIEILEQSQTGECSYTVHAESEGVLAYQYTVDRDGFVCASLVLPTKDTLFSFWKNGEYLYSDTYTLPQTLSICQATAGDILEIRIGCDAGVRGTMTIHTALLDESLFRQGFDILNASTLQLTGFSNTRVEGNIHCNRDGILYTSIPQDGNWRAFVDGEPAQIQLIGDAMVGLSLTEGNHNISFIYENAAFSLGWKISLICTAVFIGLYISIYRPFQKRNSSCKKKTESS